MVFSKSLIPEQNVLLLCDLQQPAILLCRKLLSRHGSLGENVPLPPFCGGNSCDECILFKRGGSSPAINCRHIPICALWPQPGEKEQTDRLRIIPAIPCPRLRRLDIQQQEERSGAR